MKIYFDEYLLEKMGINKEVESLTDYCYNIICEILSYCEITENSILMDRSKIPDIESKYGLKIQQSSGNLTIIFKDNIPEWITYRFGGSFLIKLIQNEKWSAGPAIYIEYNFKKDKKFKHMLQHEIEHRFKFYNNSLKYTGGNISRMEQGENILYYMFNQYEITAYFNTIYQELKYKKITNKSNFIKQLDKNFYFNFYKMVATLDQDAFFDTITPLLIQHPEYYTLNRKLPTSKKIDSKIYKKFQTKAKLFMIKIYKLWDLIQNNMT